jgi:hypothetical protein
MKKQAIVILMLAISLMTLHSKAVYALPNTSPSSDVQLNFAIPGKFPNGTDVTLGILHVHLSLGTGTKVYERDLTSLYGQTYVWHGVTLTDWRAVYSSNTGVDIWWNGGDIDKMVFQEISTQLLASQDAFAKDENGIWVRREDGLGGAWTSPLGYNGFSWNATLHNDEHFIKGFNSLNNTSLEELRKLAGPLVYIFLADNSSPFQAIGEGFLLKAWTKIFFMVYATNGHWENFEIQLLETIPLTALSGIPNGDSYEISLSMWGHSTTEYYDGGHYLYVPSHDQLIRLEGGTLGEKYNFVFCGRVSGQPYTISFWFDPNYPASEEYYLVVPEFTSYLFIVIVFLLLLISLSQRSHSESKRDPHASKLLPFLAWTRR